ncbi:hypothetical protein [Paraburkholderia bonniea]|uniref:hypothetical protein n=1 Tax=Paraburkholderia bonniea TaxID=2152891 RepID=UPI001C2C13CA|nr:hypothetical protein [Paraburkholderia bonniea]
MMGWQGLMPRADDKGWQAQTSVETADRKADKARLDEPRFSSLARSSPPARAQKKEKFASRHGVFFRMLFRKINCIKIARIAMQCND